LQAEVPDLAALVGALSPDGVRRSSAAALQRRALAAASASVQAPPHDHGRPAWARPGAAAALPLRPHLGRTAVALDQLHLDR